MDCCVCLVVISLGFGFLWSENVWQAQKQVNSQKSYPLKHRTKTTKIDELFNVILMVLTWISSGFARFLHGLGIFGPQVQNTLFH